MSTTSIIIQRGLPEGERLAAAAIYYTAFARKFQGLLDEKRGVPVLARLFDPAYAIVALDSARDGRVVGIAGFHHAGGHFVTRQRAPYVEAYGWLGGLWRWFWMSVDQRAPEPGQLMMDGLGVDPAYRGQGIGTRLLAAMVALAQELDYATVRLAVVDTNPRARALYEREGFRAVRTVHLPGMQWLAGFGAYTTMVKPVKPTD